MRPYFTARLRHGVGQKLEGFPDSLTKSNCGLSNRSIWLDFPFLRGATRADYRGFIGVFAPSRADMRPAKTRIALAVSPQFHQHHAEVFHAGTNSAFLLGRSRKQGRIAAGVQPQGRPIKRGTRHLLSHALLACSRLWWSTVTISTLSY